MIIVKRAHSTLMLPDDTTDTTSNGQRDTIS